MTKRIDAKPNSIPHDQLLIADGEYLCCNKCGKLYRKLPIVREFTTEELALIDEYADIIAESILWPYIHDETSE